MKHRYLVHWANLYSLLKNQKNGDIIRSSVMATRMDRQDSMQMHLT